MIQWTNELLLTVALLADFGKNTEELWRWRRQRIQLHLLEILWAIFLQMSIVFAQAAHNHVCLREIEKSRSSVRISMSC